MKKCKWLLLIVLIFSYFLTPYLPPAWGWENGVLEWLQVAILASGLVLNGFWWHETRSANLLSSARFLAWAILLWVIMLGRELSWGRVFFASGFDPVTGPTFIPLAELSYGWIIKLVRTVIIVLFLYGVIRYSLYKTPFRVLKKGQFPVAELLITIFAFVVVLIGEKMHLQVMEEYYEVFAYLGLILTAYGMKVALQKEDY